MFIYVGHCVMKSHKAGAFISELTVECGVTKKKKKSNSENIYWEDFESQFRQLSFSNQQANVQSQGLLFSCGQ